MKDQSRKSSFSDTEIIAGLKAGGHSFEKFALVLFRNCENYIHTAIKKHPAVPEQDLRDAYIDAVDAVVKKVISGGFDSTASKLSTYLHQVFSNKCIDQFRRITNHKNDWQRKLGSITDDLPIQSQDFLQSIMEKDELTGLVGIMDNLGENCKDLIMDFDYWGFKPDEVADRRGYKTGKSASQAKYRCMEELRKMIDKKTGE